MAISFPIVGGDDDGFENLAPNPLGVQAYAIKTLENGLAELEGDHVANAAQDFDERGKVAIKMNMDKIGTTSTATTVNHGSNRRYESAKNQTFMSINRTRSRSWS